jgi:hypothetical protein
MPKNILSLFVTVMFSLALFLLAGEIFVRIFVPKYQWEFRDSTSDWQADSRLGWAQKPYLNIKERLDDGTVSIFRTNADGVFPAASKREKNPRIIRIMFFGDSVVVGRAVPQDKTVTASLERVLCSRNIPVEVINAGVQGYSTDQVFLYMQRLVPLYKPDIVVYGVCVNDFSGNMSSQACGLNKPFFVLKSNGELIESQAGIKNSKIRMFDHGPRKWIQFSALYRLFRIGIIRIRSGIGEWRGRNLPEIAETYYHCDKTVLECVDFELFTALLKNMKRISVENNAVFLFYLHPSLAEVWEPFIQVAIKKMNISPAQYDRHNVEQAMLEIAESNSLYFCPLISYFINNQARGPFHLLPRDSHCNEKGYLVTSERLARFLQDYGLLKRY